MMLNFVIGQRRFKKLHFLAIGNIRQHEEEAHG